jgi:putative endonuclease
MAYRQVIGATGEEFVARHLQSEGCTILDRNWRIRGGEIDLIAAAPSGLIIFVEVKTRSSTKFGDPLEAITAKKAARIQRLALGWLSSHSRFGSDFRIDCAAVLLQPNGEMTLDYRRAVL